jgi:hypothetical protein
MDPGYRKPAPLALAFAPIHKRALGVAAGTAFGLLIFAITVFHVVFRPVDTGVTLLSQYFYGYELSWKGAFVGLFWGFVTGFVMGWFVAFARNFANAIRIFALRTKAELAQTKDFLDHI